MAKRQIAKVKEKAGDITDSEEEETSDKQEPETDLIYTTDKGFQTKMSPEEEILPHGVEHWESQVVRMKLMRYKKPEW